MPSAKLEVVAARSPDAVRLVDRSLSKGQEMALLSRIRAWVLVAVLIADVLSAVSVGVAGRWDKVMGFAVLAGIVLVLRPTSVPVVFAAVWVATPGVTLAVLWELYERLIGDLAPQVGYTDTIVDLFAGGLGTLTAGVLVVGWAQARCSWSGPGRPEHWVGSGP